VDINDGDVPASAAAPVEPQTAIRNMEQALADARKALEQKTAELTGALATMHATLESTTDAILVVDRERMVKSINRKYRAMWRLPEAVAQVRTHGELLAFTCRQFADPREYLARIEAIHAASPPESFDLLELADGRVLERYSCVQLVDGRDSGRVWSFRDVTGWRNSENALREESRILELLNLTGVAIASTLDMRTLLQTVTDAATRLTGAEFGAFLPHPALREDDAFTLSAYSGAGRETFGRTGHAWAVRLLGPVFHGGPALRSDDLARDPRTSQWLAAQEGPAASLPLRSCLVVPVVSRSDQVVGGLLFGHSRAAMFSDRAERLIMSVAAQAAIAIDNARLYEVARNAAAEREKLLEAERTARAEAERMSRLKDEFLAMLAHELRNPLAPISSAAQLLGFIAGEPERVRQTGEIITRQADHMTALVNDMLDVARVTRGLVTLNRTPLDFNEIVRHALDQVRPLIVARRHALSLTLAPEPSYVDGDATRLVQICANILSNAAKYTQEDGLIEVRVSASRETVLFSVKDNGVGIDPEFVPQIFELFAQGKRSLDRSQGGLGLGLSLVKKLVDLHDGEVSMISAGQKKGSECIVRLPRADHAPQPGTTSPSGMAARQPVGDRLRIMVVDDNRDAADSLAMVLQAAGHAVVVEYAAPIALAHALASPPDVFILDIGLPDMDGYALARKLRSNPATAGAVLIAVTGYGQEQDRLQAKEAGFLHHLVKPIDTAQLLTLLARPTAAIAGHVV
jgi:signal transduction histidine kinase/ActR/RegA family two-component response regulator